MAHRTGIEPVTFAVTGRRDKPLHYRCIKFGGSGEIRTHGILIWRKVRESNSKGAINTRRFSRPVPSPIGLTFHYSYRLIKSFPYLFLTYSSTGSKSCSYKTFTSGLASNFANHCSVLNPLTSVIVPCTIKSGI